ncbi:phasin family protein [Clostridium niameyense]|uniref:phasin family protein n=1 Tax=Clostridium niameyense TaxID=1622073 RepID=UPI00067EC6CA|nr:phasin family protein [Clostridium niameyense]
MINQFKNILLAGIGSAAYTYEKASNLIDEMVKKGKLTVGEGKELSEELKRTVEYGKKGNINKCYKYDKLSKEDIINILKEMNFAKQTEVEELKNKIQELENKINNLKK